MCGRAYETYTEEELELRYLSRKRKRQPIGDLKPNYNLSPTQISPIIVMKEQENTIELARWGLIPAWAKDIKAAEKYSLINAKAEEIQNKRSYKASFEKKRCIIPLSGFFEWKQIDEKGKQPFAIHMKDHSILSIAGIWEHWKSKETNEEINSFSIITCTANSVVEKIHNRMPVVLAPEHEELWLSSNTPLDSLKSLLKPCPDHWLTSYKVSPLVNSPKNNREEILAHY